MKTIVFMFILSLGYPVLAGPVTGSQLLFLPTETLDIFDNESGLSIPSIQSPEIVKIRSVEFGNASTLKLVGNSEESGAVFTIFITFNSASNATKLKFRLLGEQGNELFLRRSQAVNFSKNVEGGESSVSFQIAASVVSDHILTSHEFERGTFLENDRAPWFHDQISHLTKALDLVFKKMSDDSQRTAAVAEAGKVANKLNSLVSELDSASQENELSITDRNTIVVNLQSLNQRILQLADLGIAKIERSRHLGATNCNDAF